MTSIPHQHEQIAAPAGPRRGGIWHWLKTATPTVLVIAALAGLVSDLAVDWSDAALDSIFLCFGGVGDFRHVWRYDGTAWQARSGAAGSGTELLDVEHNAIQYDRTTNRVYTGANIGVWESADGGTTWRQLGITLVYHGVTSKLATYERILRDEKLTDGQVAYMGDDVVDLAVLARAGLSAAPGDAVDEVKAAVDWISTQAAGRGAAREFLELILKAQGHWDSIIASYVNEQGTPGDGDQDEATVRAIPRS